MINFEKYRYLLLNDAAMAFLTKLHGLELLFVLHQCEHDKADNGIEDTLKMISHFKPRRAAFTIYIQLLKFDTHIIKITSEKKESKSVLRMSEDIGKVFKTS